MTIWCFKVVKNIATHVVLLLETWWGHVLYRRQVKQVTLQLGKKIYRSRQVCHISFYISFTAFLYNILWCSFPKRLSLSIFEICFLQPGMPATEARETHGRWCFLSSIPWNQRLWWATFSSITQARIITVQLLVCVAATARIGIGPLVGRVNQPSAVALAGYSQSGAKL